MSVPGQPEYRHLPLASLTASANQPRKDFNTDDLAALAQSISQVGMLQPILACPAGPDTYRIVAGERRARAAHIAGLIEVPVLVLDSDEKHAFLLAVVENTSRADLQPLEEAAAYQVLEQDLGLTHEQIAARVGRSRQHVGNTMRLLRLPGNVQRFVAEGLISAGHARSLLPVKDPFACYLLAQRTMDEELSVRALEDIVRNGRYYGAEGPASPHRRSKRPSAGVTITPEFEAVENWLETRMTETRPRATRPGSFNIQFADTVDRARLLALLSVAAESQVAGSGRGSAFGAQS